MSDLADAIAALMARSRHGPGVHMDNSHMPLPSERQAAEGVAREYEDRIRTLKVEVERLRGVIEQHHFGVQDIEDGLYCEDCTDARQALEGNEGAGDG